MSVLVWLTLTSVRLTRLTFGSDLGNRCLLFLNSVSCIDYNYLTLSLKLLTDLFLLPSGADFALRIYNGLPSGAVNLKCNRYFAPNWKQSAP